MSGALIYQGSGGTLGDIFFSSVPMYHLKKTQGYKIYVALPADLDPEIRALYDCHTFLDGIHTLPDIREKPFLEYANSQGLEPHVFLKTPRHWKGVPFYSLKEWFRNPLEPNLQVADCIGVQIMSTSNWDRPPIPFWKQYMSLIGASGLRPVFMGTQKDEERFQEVYEGILDYCPAPELWRFGGDSILQTLANLQVMKGVLVFSSWTTYGAVLQGVPALELWNRDQWLFYTPIVRCMIGQPVHYLQEAFDSPPSSAIFAQTFPHLRRLSEILYN